MGVGEKALPLAIVRWPKGQATSMAMATKMLHPLLPFQLAQSDAQALVARLSVAPDLAMNLAQVEAPCWNVKCGPLSPWPFTQYAVES